MPRQADANHCAEPGIKPIQEFVDGFLVTLAKDLEEFLELRRTHRSLDTSARN